MAKQNFSPGANPYSFYNRRRSGSTDTIGDVLEGFLTTVGAQEQDREDRRQKWRDEQAAFAKSRDELKASPNQNANAFMANWSQGLQDNARNLQYQLENGQIKSSDYTKAWANLTNTNTQLISAQTNYQQQAQKLYEDFTAGTGSEANMQAINEFNRLTDWANLKTEINEDGSMNVFNTKTGEVVTPYFLSNLTGSNVLKYQAQAEAKKIVDQFGARSVRNGLGVTIQGTYLHISEDGEAQAELEEALTSVSRGMLNNSSTASVLIDQLGYTTVWDKKDVKKGKTILRKADGTFDVEDEQHAADAFMLKTLKAALPYTKEEPKPPKPSTQTDGEKKARVLRQKEIGYLQSIDNAISGDPATAQASIDAMIQGANVIYGKSPGIDNIQNAVRSEDGNTITVTRINDSGSTTSTPYDIRDPNKAGEVFLKLFFPTVTGSYTQLLTDFNKQQGGFTTRKIKNPKYDPKDVDDLGAAKENQFILNPKYKGASQIGRTEGTKTIKHDFDSAEVLGKKLGDEKPLKVIIDNAAEKMKFYLQTDPGLRRSIFMADGIEEAFKLLKLDFPNLNATSNETEEGLVLTIPSLFKGTLVLGNNSDLKDKRNYKKAVKAIFNAIAKGTPFDKSKFEKK